MMATTSLIVHKLSISLKELGLAWKGLLSWLRTSKDGKVVFNVPLAVMVLASIKA